MTQVRYHSQRGNNLAAADQAETKERGSAHTSLRIVQEPIKAILDVSSLSTPELMKQTYR